jgi:hypothetical protein
MRVYKKCELFEPRREALAAWWQLLHGNMIKSSR